MAPQILPINGFSVAASHEHRGGLVSDPVTNWPPSNLLKRAGGKRVVSALLDNFYSRAESDPLLHDVFPHFMTFKITPFFLAALGGPNRAKGTTAIGPFHRGTVVTKRLASRWLKLFKDALQESPIDDVVSSEILQWLRPIAVKLVNTADGQLASQPLIRSCEGVATEQFISRKAVQKLAARGQLSELQHAVRIDPGLIQHRDVAGRTLLWEAVARKRDKVTAWLIDQGCDVNLPGCDPSTINMTCSGTARLGTAVSVTPLALAISKRARKIVDQLVSAGALVDVFSLAYLGDDDRLSELLKTHPHLARAEDPAEDFKRITPLHHAIAGGHLETARLLIGKKAQVRPHSKWLLTHAALQNRADLVELLLDNKADVHESRVLGPLDNQERPVGDLLISRGFDINSDSDFGAMLVRTCRGDVSSNETGRVKTLLEYGADVNRTHYGMTPLHYAARSCQLPLIHLLLDHGAMIDPTDDSGLTPLGHLTKTRAQADLIPVMQLLISRGANINHQNDKGETVLFFFARRPDARIVKWLLENGADPTVLNRRGKSVIDIVEKKSAESFGPIRSLCQSVLK